MLVENQKEFLPKNTLLKMKWIVHRFAISEEALLPDQKHKYISA
jgi:hypothetical protein